MRNPFRRGGLLAVTAVILAMTSLLAAVPASAHAALVGSDPEEGAALSAAPTSITLSFNENIGRADVALTSPDGTSVDVSHISAVDADVRADVAAVDQKGTYTVAYRVVSADGHPISGSFGFDVTAGRAVAQVEPPADDTFLHRHRSHVVWGVLAAIVAIALLLAPLRRRDDADRA
ncbi:MAG: copper resistance protein CopC [Aeromicrobium sp.]|nr:copper resistance protein CopC [Aeromicrobium sp.]